MNDKLMDFAMFVFVVAATCAFVALTIHLIVDML